MDERLKKKKNLFVEIAEHMKRNAEEETTTASSTENSIQWFKVDQNKNYFMASARKLDDAISVC